MAFAFAGGALARLDYRTRCWDAQLSAYLQCLQAQNPNKPVLLVGDLNVAHTKLDYHNPENPRTTKQAGTTPEEQQSFGKKLLDAAGMVDIHRYLYPGRSDYSYYSARLGSRGRTGRLGMRLDYVLLSSNAVATKSEVGLHKALSDSVVSSSRDDSRGKTNDGRHPVSQSRLIFAMPLETRRIVGAFGVVGASSEGTHPGKQAEAVRVQGSQPVEQQSSCGSELPQQPGCAYSVSSYVEERYLHPYSDHCPVGINFKPLYQNHLTLL